MTSIRHSNSKYYDLTPKNAFLPNELEKLLFCTLFFKALQNVLKIVLNYLSFT